MQAAESVCTKCTEIEKRFAQGEETFQLVCSKGCIEEEMVCLLSQFVGEWFAQKMFGCLIWFAHGLLVTENGLLNLCQKGFLVCIEKTVQT